MDYQDVLNLARSLAAAALVGVVWFALRRVFRVEALVTGVTIFALSVVLYGSYIHLVEPNPGGEVERILQGNLSSTFQFRLLVPLLALALSIATGISISTCAHIMQFVSLVAALWVLWLWFGVWFIRDGAFLGLFAAAAVLPSTFHYWYCSEFAELALCTGGYVLLLRRPGDLTAMLALLALAVLNKETGALLLWPWVLVQWARGDRRVAVVTAVAGAALALGILAALGQYYGKSWGHPNQLALNLHSLFRHPWALIRTPGYRRNLLLVAGGLWPIALWRLNSAPRLLRLCASTVLPLLVLAVPFAYIAETRIYHPVLAPVLALIVWQLAPSLRRADFPRIGGDEMHP
ncbi:MAG: hypothetical protein HPY44_11195 [Armatimonadetes bacterium]|nr:hypothetical protein [Armatimonadota bacterium]